MQLKSAKMSFWLYKAKSLNQKNKQFISIAEKKNLNRSRQSSDANILSKCQKPIPKAARL
jgi:hypothetical protein